MLIQINIHIFDMARNSINAVNAYQFRAKEFEVKPYPLRLGNISNDFTIDNMKKNWIK